MKFINDEEEHEIIIERKNNKNTYIRVKTDLKIYVTTNYLTRNKEIIELIEDNRNSIIKMINQAKRKSIKEKSFYLLGKEYDLIKCNIMKSILIDEDKIYYKTEASLNSFLRKKADELFKERLDICYSKIDNIPYPKLIIKKMTRKWGYCNKNAKTICLNLNLIRYDIDEIDYVIIHELCHFLHFNHSKEFWKSVSKYKPDYKLNRKVLNEE